MGGLIMMDVFLIFVNNMSVLLIGMAVLDLADPLVASDVEVSFIEAQRMGVVLDQVLSVFGAF
jgi:hypothetical protein